MKAVYMKEPWSIEVKDIEQRKPEKNEALLAIKAAGICGSDIGAFRGTNGLVSYPRIIGHELAGEIISIPEDNPKGLKKGDKVVVDPYLYCGKCYPCSIGRTNCCNDLHVLGVHVDGGMAETFAHPADMLVKAPADMSWEMMACAEPLTIALHGIHRLGLKAGEHIAISGAGTIGLLTALAAIAYRAEPILIDLVEERLEFAKKLGVKYTIDLKKDDLMEKIKEYTDGRLCECDMEASGANSAIRSSLDIVCHAGRVVFTGWPNKETSIPTDMITRKEIDIRGARTSAGEFEEALALIHDKKIPMEQVVTKVVPVDEAADVLRDIEAHPADYLKVIVKF
ncbi:MAG: alcohol dehydrogenase catalytic domain-containing protein [Firmicutes bacterium]|nr:alcohol dehydrogenase catalytic domain-containing protein [Bacillota bacterium]